MRQPSSPLRLRSLPKDVRPLARTALAAGWRITVSRGTCHSHWLSPCGVRIICSGSPSDTANVTIMRRLLKRAGLAV